MADNFRDLELDWLATIVGIGANVLQQEEKPDAKNEEWVLTIKASLEDVDDMEWAALPLLYTLAVVSFSGAKPIGNSDNEYNDKDELYLEDFLPSVRYENAGLSWCGDYIKGRRIKTQLRVFTDGTFFIETYARGKAAYTWLKYLKGERRLSLVE